MARQAVSYESGMNQKTVLDIIMIDEGGKDATISNFIFPTTMTVANNTQGVSW